MVSCSVSRMRVLPVNCWCAIVLMRRIILRRISIAGGTTMMLNSDITGSCTAMTAASPMRESRSRPIEVIRRLSTWLAAAAPVVSRGHELGAVAVGKETDVVLQQPGEHLALIVGDDAVADACERERLSIGGQRLDHEDHGGHESEDDDAGQVLVNIGLIDHVADQIGAERGAGAAIAHQAECERIAPPLARRLLRRAAAGPGGRAVGVRKQPLKIRFMHTHPVARPLEPRRQPRPSCPGGTSFQGESAQLQDARIPRRKHAVRAR